MPGVTIRVVEVSARDVAKIPRGNIKVPRDEFAAVWSAAERRSAEQGARGVTDWYAGGVVVTCRWLAAATVRPATGDWYLAYSPVTKRGARAMYEVITAEVLEVEKLLLRDPQPWWLTQRPGWIEGITATFDWAWRRTSGPPIPVPPESAAAG